ncbi:hypothetical protein [Allonocardiopsis opalescens]|uniref:hypothetical protein n=1 Tax=Allonocardiopsis opalescens TaxID=1144618 RepID=UPI0011B2507D|nr:hypothetical protein [Allonocardiopsis opalescens]
MAHAAPQTAAPESDERPPWLLLVIAAVVIAVASLVIWPLGGFRTAPEPVPQLQAGAQARNALLAITPVEVRVFTDDSEFGGGTYIELVADLEVLDRRPMSAWDLNTALEARLMPSTQELDHFEIRVERDPEAIYSSLNPGMPERAMIRWPVEALAEGDNEVRIQFWDVVYQAGFVDESSRWFIGDRVIAEYRLPLAGAGE